MKGISVISFKQFLEGKDPLEDLQHTMIIRLLMPELSTSEAEDVLTWVSGTNDTYEALPDALADKIANSKLAQTDYVGQDISQEPDHLVSELVHAKIWRLIGDAVKSGKITESKDPLEDIAVEMFFRQELNLPNEEAKEAALWFQYDKDWGDLEWDTRDHVIDYVQDTRYPDIYDYTRHQIPEMCWVAVRDAMNSKYGITI